MNWFTKISSEINIDKIIQNVVIANDTLDAHRGEVYCVIQAKYNNHIVGIINYSIYNREINIKYMEVSPFLRRKGLGTKMMNNLKMYADQSGFTINYGMLTRDGSNFVDQYGEKPK